MKSCFFGQRRWAMFSFWIIFGLGCSNDLDKIKKITYDPNAPDEVSKNMTINFIEGEQAQMRIFVKHAETYTNPHLTKLKDSIKIDFLGENGETTSTLTAKYGQIDHEKNSMFVKDSVQLTNHADKRTMYTSILHWNQEDSTIYTNENVRLVSPKGTAYGSSLTAKQDFTSYKITNPRGAYEFEQNIPK